MEFYKRRRYEDVLRNFGADTSTMDVYHRLSHDETQRYVARSLSPRRCDVLRRGAKLIAKVKLIRRTQCFGGFSKQILVLSDNTLWEFPFYYY